MVKLRWVIFISLVNGTACLMGIDIDSPEVGFGTYPYRGKTCQRAVTQACELGYRIFDTATFYQNFDPIAKAIGVPGIDRKNLYLISKVWPDSQTPEKLKKDLKNTLEELQVSYLDAYLLHWPNHKISIRDTLETMKAFKEAGLIRHIGLSNINVNHLKRILELNIEISWVQVEMHPHFYDSELLHFCKEHSIGILAWAPLGRGRLIHDPFLKKLGKKYDKTPAQIAIKWIIQHHCIPLPGSQNPDHMKQNRDIEDFVLSNEDMEEIDSRAAKGERERISEKAGLGFSDEFDFSYEECWPNDKAV